MGYRVAVLLTLTISVYSDPVWSIKLTQFAARASESIDQGTVINFILFSLNSNLVGNLNYFSPLKVPLN